MLKFSLISFNKPNKLEISSRLFSTLTDKDLAILRELPKMQFSKAVEEIQRILPEPRKLDLSMPSPEEEGLVVRLKSPEIECKEILFVFECIISLEPEFKEIIEDLRASLHITERKGDAALLLKEIAQIFDQLSKAGQEFKRLAVIVKAARKNFSSIDSLAFDAFSSSLTGEE